MRTSIVVICGALALSGVAGAAAVQDMSILAQVQQKTTEGTIKSVDAKANTFVISTGIGNDKKDITVTVNADTKYTLDGKDSTMALALVAGNTAKVRHIDNRATTVDAKSPKKPG